MLILLLAACSPVCGSVNLSTAATGAELFDTDGDGFTDLTEVCGEDAGSYGLVRPDLGWAQMILSADGDPDGKIDFAITTYVLGVADLWFLEEHLVVGNTITADQLAGSGIHQAHGTADLSYLVYAYTTGSIEVLDERQPDRITRDLFEEDNPREYLLRWDVAFSGEQFWTGEDWVQFMDSSDRSDPVHTPPDAE